MNDRTPLTESIASAGAAQPPGAAASARTAVSPYAAVRSSQRSRGSWIAQPPFVAALALASAHLALACSGTTETPGGSAGANVGASPGAGEPTPGNSAGTGNSPGGNGNGGRSGAPEAGSGAKPSAGSSTGGANTGGTSEPAAMPVPPASQACPSPKVPATPLRRLTRFEYANTARSLLNVDVSAASDLPVDEITNGFNNNAAVLTVSPLHAEKYVLVSEALAKSAVQNITTLAPCAAGMAEDTCAQNFAKSFGRRAFRHALTAEDEKLLMAAYQAGKTGGTYAEGIEVMIRAALQSPHFLYRLELTTPTSPGVPLVPLSQFELATRLSYLIWSSGPDDELLDAAARGELSSKEKVATRVRNMLASPKARAAITEFYNQWLGTSRLAVTSKDTKLFPTYSDDLRNAIAQEVPAFVEYVLWSGDHKLNTLLTSSVAFVNRTSAPVYGVPAPAGAAMQMVTLPESQGRSGVLTQAGFLAVQAHPEQTSPVLRGKFVRARLMCQPPPPPPPDADITPPHVDANSTARERFSAHQAAGTSCNTCHQLMDNIGFAFENFDAIGQYRTQENNRDIDVSGNIVGTADAALQGNFKGVKELATKLAASETVQDCVATQWFRYSVGRNEEEADACSLATLQESFGTSKGDLVELIVGMTQTDAFWFRAQQEVSQ